MPFKGIFVYDFSRVILVFKKAKRQNWKSVYSLKIEINRRCFS